MGRDTSEWLGCEEAGAAEGPYGCGKHRPEVLTRVAKHNGRIRPDISWSWTSIRAEPHFDYCFTTMQPASSLRGRVRYVESHQLSGGYSALLFRTRGVSARARQAADDSINKAKSMDRGALSVPPPAAAADIDRPSQTSCRP